MPTHYTTETWIEKARAVHGDKYDYSRSIYLGCFAKIEIGCKKCNIFFWQEAHNHSKKNGNGCPECKKKIIGNLRVDTQDSFIAKAVKRHGMLYDYSMVIYRGSSVPVLIRCTQCDAIFEMTPNKHITRDAQGCKSCGIKRRAVSQRKGIEKFVAEASIVHWGKYDYSRSVYVGLKTKLKIRCNLCDHTFWQTPSDHIHSKAGCPNCAGLMPITLESFIARSVQLHEGKYDYSLVASIKNNRSIVRISCNTCSHVFEQAVVVHLSGHGCPSCASDKKSEYMRISEDDFKRRALERHFDDYDYSLVKIERGTKRVDIRCNKCMVVFKQNIHVHLAGHGCPHCAISATQSLGEKAVSLVLDTMGISYNREVSFPGLGNGRKKLRFDFFVPMLKTCIEFQGKQHYFPEASFGNVSSDFEALQERDQRKRDWCKGNNIKLIEVRYDCKDVSTFLCEQLGVAQLPLLLR